MNVPYNIRAIKRKSLHQELAENLSQLIVNGDLAPGTKVPERQLCEQFGVSRTPLREALKVLASDGFVTLETNRGAWVSEITAEDLEEVFPVMGALEALSGELACARITDAQIDHIAALHAQMLTYYEAGDRAQYFRANQAIHEAILDAARNETLKSQYRSLAIRVRQARYVANMTAERWKQAIAEHEQMLDALRRRDGPALSEILKRHLANKMATVREWLVQEAARTGSTAV